MDTLIDWVLGLFGLNDQAEEDPNSKAVMYPDPSG